MYQEDNHLLWISPLKQKDKEHAFKQKQHIEQGVSFSLKQLEKTFSRKATAPVCVCDTLSLPLQDYSQLNRLWLKHNSDCHSAKMHVVGYVGTETNRKNTLQESLETSCSCFTLIITTTNSQPLPPDTQVSSSLAITNVAFSLQVSSEYLSDVPFLFLSLFFLLSCFPLPSFPPSLLSLSFLLMVKVIKC